ncbi:hypothetical protein [Bifidobacterium samirii]|uniref:Uncharacterized protein n=1 Tax=Bifidobacterium samirii TaxID=2306974 RepID=A0A430FUL0_9BIFI|nr:hypothetical protein [Bifidobacterium samirii]RSX56774.1 hypothetical protein D2E24_1064 [Bifidobacterium samirii]
MELKVSTPTARVGIVTDLTALRDSIDLTNRITTLDEPAQDMTEHETAALARERENLLESLAQTVQAVEASTITLTLKGLKSNEWNQIVTRCTTTADGRQTRDLARLALLAVPRMVQNVTDANGTMVDTDETAITTLVDSLTDTQTAELLTTVQELNTPVSSLPKETLTLLSSTT